MKHIQQWIDPFTVLLLLTVALASLLPCRGTSAKYFATAAACGIFLLFFLHGAKLSPDAIRAGALNWKLQGSVLLVTFALFPLLGLIFQLAPGFRGPLAIGLMFLTLLPSTVQSSIAFTSIAGGNVAAAVCAASFSNLAAIFLTPMLTALLIAAPSGSGGSAVDAVRSIAVSLLLPFMLGQLARPWIGAFLVRHKAVVGRVDRGSILLVVYTAFSAAVVEGLWHRVSGLNLAMITVTTIAILLIVLAVSWQMGRFLRLDRADAIVLLFCGSKKSLASGVPIAGTLFPAAQVGLVILPLMLFHQIQLIVCAMIARNLAATSRESRSDFARPEPSQESMT